jgi:hypothetical protein
MFYFSRDRKGEHPQGHLARYAGIPQADAYDGYNQLYELTKHALEGMLSPSMRMPTT